MKGRAIKTDPIIPKVWLWIMVVRQTLGWEVYSCILFQRAARKSRIFSNTAHILTKVKPFIQHWSFDPRLDNSGNE